MPDIAKNMEDFFHDPRHHFVRGDICDQALVKQLCQEHGIEAIVHFAAESHVDRSIDDPPAFLETNVRGTFTLARSRSRDAPSPFPSRLHR